MTDRELLELAAKAAGMEGMRYSAVFGMAKMLDPSRPESTGSIGRGWNPLTDDGDALRLAVRLGLAVLTRANFTAEHESMAIVRRVDVDVEQPHGDDPDAANRRAIVRAAAAIAQQRGSGEGE